MKHSLPGVENRERGSFLREIDLSCESKRGFKGKTSRVPSTSSRTNHGTSRHRRHPRNLRFHYRDFSFCSLFISISLEFSPRLSLSLYLSRPFSLVLACSSSSLYLLFFSLSHTRFVVLPLLPPYPPRRDDDQTSAITLLLFASVASLFGSLPITLFLLLSALREDFGVLSAKGERARARARCSFNQERCTRERERGKDRKRGRVNSSHVRLFEQYKEGEGGLKPEGGMR